MLKQKTYYTEEFRTFAVKVAIESKKPIRETARALDVNVNTFYTWINKYKKEVSETNSLKVNENAKDLEIVRLSNELKKLKGERIKLKQLALTLVKYCH